MQATALLKNFEKNLRTTLIYTSTNAKYVQHCVISRCICTVLILHPILAWAWHSPRQAYSYSLAHDKAVKRINTAVKHNPHAIFVTLNIYNVPERKLNNVITRTAKHTNIPRTFTLQMRNSNMSCSFRPCRLFDQWQIKITACTRSLVNCRLSSADYVTSIHRHFASVYMWQLPPVNHISRREYVPDGKKANRMRSIRNLQSRARDCYAMFGAKEYFPLVSVCTQQTQSFDNRQRKVLTCHVLLATVCNVNEIKQNGNHSRSFNLYKYAVRWISKLLQQ